MHLDGHIDFDWIPDETVGRIAAADVDELPDLELHPYALNGEVYDRFAIWNFIYPAARLGMIREFVWVVPDGTLEDMAGLVRGRILGKIQMLTLQDAASLQRDGRVLRGVVLGLPITVCELADLPEIDEAVLLDIDLDYFTTRSAITQGVTAAPWTGPDEVIEVLRQRGVRTDLATLSLSTIGGFLPPSSRWLGEAMRERLRGRPSAVPEELVAARSLEAAGTTQAAEACARWTRNRPEDPTAWFLYSRALRGIGRTGEAARAWEEAVRLDPLLEHEELFEADRLWRNQEAADALAYYTGYLARVPDSPFRAHALRRKAGCLVQVGRDAEAVQALWEVLELAPGHGDSHLDLGLLLRKRGMVHQALEEFRMARGILPDRADYAMALGTTYLMAGRVQESIDHLGDAVSRRPCWQEARGNLAVALLQAGRFEEAVREVNAGLALQPQTPALIQAANELRRRGHPVATVRNVAFE